MDQRTSAVEEDVKEILRTRLALAEKLQLLERRVEEKIQGTKTAALDVINHARDTAIDLVETTTEALDPVRQASRRPWALVGGALLIGLAAGLIEQRRKAGGVYPYYPAGSHGADVMPSNGNGHTPRGVYPFYHRGPIRQVPSPVESDTAEDSMSAVVKQMSSLWEDIAGELAAERERIRETALQTGRAFLRDAAKILVHTLLNSLSRPQAERSTRGRMPPSTG